MHIHRFEDQLRILGEFENVKYTAERSATIMPGWAEALEEAFVSIQNVSNKVMTDNGTVVWLWIDREELHNGIVNLRSKHYGSVFKTVEDKKLLDKCIKNATNRFARKVKDKCVFCGEHATHTTFANTILHRCAHHRYLGIRDFSQDNWDDLYGPRLEEMSRVIDLLINEYTKWQAANDVIIDTAIVYPAGKRISTTLEPPIASPCFIGTFSLMLFLRAIDKTTALSKSKLDIQTICEQIRSAYSFGVDTLTGLATLSVIKMIEACDAVVAMSVLESFLILNKHSLTADHAECFRAAKVLKEGVWSPARYAEWLSASIDNQVNGGDVWAA